MSQLLKQFIGDNQVGADQIRLENNAALKARNAANSADIPLVKLDASDYMTIGNGTAANMDILLDAGPGSVVNVDALQFILRNGDGVASPKLTLSNADASESIGLRAPDALAASYDLYLPEDGGMAGQVLGTDGSGNLVWATSAADFTKETFVLSAGDITNQYVELTVEAAVDSIQFLIKGAGVVLEGASYDYTVDYIGGTGGVTRITFANDIATGGPAALIAGNVIQIQYVAA